MDHVYRFLTLYALLAAVFIINENRRPQATLPGCCYSSPFRASASSSTCSSVAIVGSSVGGASLFSRRCPAGLASFLRTLGNNTIGTQRDGAPRRTGRTSRALGASQRAFHPDDGEPDRSTAGCQRHIPAAVRGPEAATHFIYLQTYSLASDEVGAELKAILLDKAASGVKVCLLYDPVGFAPDAKPILPTRVARGGVRVEPYSPIWRLHILGHRNHRRIAVIDGVVGYTGGLNNRARARRTRWRLRRLAGHAPPDRGFGDGRAAVDLRDRLAQCPGRGPAREGLPGDGAKLATRWANAGANHRLGT